MPEHKSLKMGKPKIRVSTEINQPVEKVWELWTSPEHIVHWNNASDDWISPSVVNDLREGGKFIYRMEAKDGSAGFDFTGMYEKVKKFKEIDYILDDHRKVKVKFEPGKNLTRIEEILEVEKVHSVEMQKTGWQAILDNFRKYAEAQ